MTMVPVHAMSQPFLRKDSVRLEVDHTCGYFRRDHNQFASSHVCVHDFGKLCLYFKMHTATPGLLQACM